MAELLWQQVSSEQEWEIKDASCEQAQVSMYWWLTFGPKDASNLVCSGTGWYHSNFNEHLHAPWLLRFNS